MIILYDEVIITNHALKRLIERAYEAGIKVPDDLENYLRKIIENSFRVKKHKNVFIKDINKNISSYWFRVKKFDDWYFISIKEENCLKIVTFIRKGDFEESLPRIIACRYYNGRLIKLWKKKKKTKKIYCPFPKFDKLIIRNFEEKELLKA